MHRHQTDSMLMGSLLKPGELLEQMLQWLAEAGIVIGLQQTTSWWLAGNGWTKLCLGCPTDIKACCPPAYKVRIWPLGRVLLQEQLCQPDSGTGCFCQLSLQPWMCMTSSKMVLWWQPMQGRLLCKPLHEGNTVAFAKTCARLMHVTVHPHRPCNIGYALHLI